jgi:ribosomal protein S18 acetylase RimI-like enzyme
MTDSAAPARIRAALASDAAALGALAGELVRFHHGLDPRRFMLVDDVDRGYGRWLAREATSKDALVLVAEVDGAIIGYAYARQEPRNWNDLIDEHGKIHDVFVHPDQRGRGIARALMTAVCEQLRARGCERLMLATATANEPAQKLFAGLGFRPTMIEMMQERP